MKPYYSDDRVTLYGGDCLTVMASLPSASVDAIITDPPYSSGGQYKGDRSAATGDKYGGLSMADFSGDLPPAPAWIRHLPEWMVRDGDEDLVDMAAVAAWTARHEEQPKRGLALRHIARTNPRREAEYQATLNDRADMWAGRPQDQRPEDRA